MPTCSLRLLHAPSQVQSWVLLCSCCQLLAKYCGNADVRPAAHRPCADGKLIASRGYGSQWEVFADQIQPLARRMPWMTVGGNHERDWPDSGDRYGSIFDSGELNSRHMQPFLCTPSGQGQCRCAGQPAVCCLPTSTACCACGAPEQLLPLESILKAKRHAGGECGVSHQRRFKMPAPASEATPWYSFDFGPIHFLQYNTEVPFGKGSPQHRCALPR